MHVHQQVAALHAQFATISGDIFLVSQRIYFDPIQRREKKKKNGWEVHIYEINRGRRGCP